MIHKGIHESHDTWTPRSVVWCWALDRTMSPVAQGGLRLLYDQAPLFQILILAKWGSSLEMTWATFLSQEWADSFELGPRGSQLKRTLTPWIRRMSAFYCRQIQWTGALNNKRSKQPLTPSYHLETNHCIHKVGYSVIEIEHLIHEYKLRYLHKRSSYSLMMPKRSPLRSLNHGSRRWFIPKTWFRSPRAYN